MTTHNRLVSVGVFVAMFVSSHSVAEAGDVELFQGKWRVVTAKNNGGRIFEAKRDKMFVVIEKNELRIVIEGTKSEQAAEFTLDPNQNPKHIEFTKETRDSEWEGFKVKQASDSENLYYKLFQTWKHDEKTLAVVPTKDKVLGIYELKDDVLKICWRRTDGGRLEKPTVRPNKFESGLYHHEILFELERVKGEAKSEILKQWEAIPVPAKTPFDGNESKKAEYLRSYRDGFTWAKGTHFSCPTNPSDYNLHAIRGWVEGWQAGVKAGRTADLPAKYAPYLVWRDEGK